MTEVTADGCLLSVFNDCMGSGLKPGGGGRKEEGIVLDVNVGSRIIVDGAAVVDSVLDDEADVGIVFGELGSRTVLNDGTVEVVAVVDGKTGVTTVT